MTVHLNGRVAAAGWDHWRSHTKYSYGEHAIPYTEKNIYDTVVTTYVYWFVRLVKASTDVILANITYTYIQSYKALEPHT